MRHKAFTLVEILIVVVILGVLASIVVPQFASATSQTQEVATLEQLTHLRRALAVYTVRNSNAVPAISSGVGTWAELLSGDYLRMGPPANGWVGGVHARDVVIRSTPDTAYHRNYGWIYDPATGDIWAASFDGADKPFPQP